MVIRVYFLYFIYLYIYLFIYFWLSILYNQYCFSSISILLMFHIYSWLVITQSIIDLAFFFFHLHLLCSDYISQLFFWTVFLLLILPLCCLVSYIYIEIFYSTYFLIFSFCYFNLFSYCSVLKILVLYLAPCSLEVCRRLQTWFFVLVV